MTRPSIEAEIAGDTSGPPGEQTYFPGTEPPPEDPERTPELDQVVYDWRSAVKERKAAGDVVTIKHASMLEQLREAGLDKYPYVDEYTGKKHYVVVNREPKAKTVKAKNVNAGKNKAKRSKRHADDADKTAEEKKADRAEKRLEEEANRVEHRKVPRASVVSEVDPFAAARGELDELEKSKVH